MLRIFNSCCASVIAIMLCSLLQSSPVGVPSLVAANTAKVDLPTLRADIPKYATSGLGPTSIQWWTNFIDTLERTMTSPWWSSSSWLFTKLCQLKRSVLPMPMEQAVLPQPLVDKRSVETSTIPQVFTCTQCKHRNMFKLLGDVFSIITLLSCTCRYTQDLLDREGQTKIPLQLSDDARPTLLRQLKRRQPPALPELVWP